MRVEKKVMPILNFGEFYDNPYDLLSDVGAFILTNTGATEFVAVLGEIDKQEIGIAAAMTLANITEDEAVQRHYEVLQRASMELKKEMDVQ